LNTRELAFCMAYVKERNASKAAKAAGFKSPQSNGASILRRPHVQEQINWLMERAQEQMVLDTGRVLTELAAIALNRVDSYFKIVDGVYVAKPPEELTEQQKMAISKINIRTMRPNDEGEVVQEFTYEFHDKMAALGRLGEHYGIGAKDGAKSKGNPFEEMEQDELDEIASLMERAMDRKAIDSTATEAA